MRALVTVFYVNSGVGIGMPPLVKIVEGANGENFLSALQLFLAGCQLEGHTVSSHTITLLPEKK